MNLFRFEKHRLRQKIFYAVVLVASPVWVLFLVLMLCWDIAQNFRGQINAGYKQIMVKEGMI